MAANLYTGRWYEIARTPNSMQADCQGATTEFSGWAGGAFKAVQTCHKGAPTGPAQVTRVDGKVLPASQNAKMQLAMLGGLISQEYWILDHADDNRWLIMCTANQRYVWLLSRAPALSAAEKAQAMAPHAAARLQPRPPRLPAAGRRALGQDAPPSKKSPGGLRPPRLKGLVNPPGTARMLSQAG